MPQQLCVLDGLTYEYNPVEAPNPDVRIVAVTQGMTGVLRDDYGNQDSARVISHSWPGTAMNATFFNALRAKQRLGGHLSFTDENGVTYTVVMMPLTWRRTVPQGEAYTDVKYDFLVVSIP
jgi:hypothetical protein